MKWIILALLFSFNVFAQLDPVAYEQNELQIDDRSPDEVWLRLQCRGIVTPKNIYPPVEKHIMTFHFKLNKHRPFPSMVEFRDTNHDIFKNITKRCTEKRLSMMDLSGLPSSTLWLDWGTDHEYTHLVVGEDIIQNSNVCRGAGRACETNQNCCRFNRCNTSTNTCVSTRLPVASPIRSVSSP